MCRVGHMKKELIEDRSITVRILRTLVEEVAVAVKHSGRYTNEADYIRVAIREKLDREKKK